MADGRTAATHRSGLNQRLRAAFINGAEDHSQQTDGRPLTADELAEVLRQYPGDLPERRPSVDKEIE